MLCISFAKYICIEAHRDNTLTQIRVQKHAKSPEESNKDTKSARQKPIGIIESLSAGSLGSACEPQAEMTVNTTNVAPAQHYTADLPKDLSSSRHPAAVAADAVVRRMDCCRTDCHQIRSAPLAQSVQASYGSAAAAGSRSRCSEGHR